MPFTRRQFLTAAVALAAVPAPSFIRRAFGDSSCPSGDAQKGHAPTVGKSEKMPTLTESWQSARNSGRPLLVFVIPEDDGKKWDRGAAFGELLNYGSDAQVSPLAHVDVVCATMSDLGKLGVAQSGEPLMVLVDPSRNTSRGLDASLPTYNRNWNRGSDYKKTLAEDDRVADKRIAALARLLQSAGTVDPTRAAEVRARLKTRRIPGSHWANGSGCGTSIEDEKDQLMVACGMGHVPVKSARFLYLYAQTPSEQARAEREKPKP